MLTPRQALPRPSQESPFRPRDGFKPRASTGLTAAKAPSFTAPALWLRLDAPSFVNKQTFLWVGLPYAEGLPPANAPAPLALVDVLDRGFFFPPAPTSPFFTPHRGIPVTDDLAAPFLRESFLGSASRRALTPRRASAASPSRPLAWSDTEPTAAHSYPPLPTPNRRRPLSRSLKSSWALKGSAKPEGILTSSQTPAALPPLAALAAPVSIPQVRFKPGLRAQWRELRIEFARLLGLRAERQQRITRYVTLLRTISGFRFIQTLALSAGLIIKQASLGAAPGQGSRPGWQRAWEGGWLLNHQPLVNPFIQVYPGDLLSAPAGVSGAVLQTPHMYRTQTQRLKPLGLAWLFQLRPTTPTPWYLEVDELTRTVTVLATPASLNDFDPTLWQTFPFLTQRMLNWKYRY